MDIQRSKQLIADIKVLVQSIRGLDLQTLKREGRDFDFVDVFPLVVSIYDALNELDRSEEWLQSLPLNAKQSLFNDLNSFYAIVTQIKTFNPSQIQNPQEHRNNLASTVGNLYNALYPILIDPMKLENVSRSLRKSAVSNVSKKAEEELSKIQHVSAEVNSLLDSAKKATADIGMTKYEGIFDSQASDHKKLAIIWLIASCGLLLVLLTILWFVTNDTIGLINKTIENKTQALNATNIASLLVAKLFFASIGFYGLYQAIKNYNVNMHLCTLNKHRSNVLKTFESFVKSSDDPKIKDTVLIKAAESIFNAGETGYIKDSGGKDGAEPLVQIFEQLKSK